MTAVLTPAQTAIECRGLIKTYTLFSEQASSLKERILRGGRGKRTTATIHALDGVNLTVQRGEIIGLIGDNGSGKSTLLKLISGITQPSSGELSVNGTVSSLLEVGVGFHPDMTGRENAYLSGALLGIPEERLTEQMPSIIAFSELEDFIDSPVKHYSSGMFLRLGFAIGIHIDPDILLIDEILAVGDQRFQRKCKDHIRWLRDSGKTIIVVSHDLDSILTLCSRAVVLNRGKVLGDGHPYEMIGLYKQHQFVESRRRGESPSAEIVKSNRHGSFDIRFDGVKLFGHDGDERHIFEPGEPFRVEFAWRAKRLIKYPVFGMSIVNDNGEYVYIVATDVTFGDIESIEGSGTVSFQIESLNLLEGAYSLSFAVTQREEGPGSAFNFYEGFDYCHTMSPFWVKPGSKGHGLRGQIYMPCKAVIETNV